MMFREFKRLSSSIVRAASSVERELVSNGITCNANRFSVNCCCRIYRFLRKNLESEDSQGILNVIDLMDAPLNDERSVFLLRASILVGMGDGPVKAELLGAIDRLTVALALLREHKLASRRYYGR